MKEINDKLFQYIQDTILPQYNLNDNGHGTEHIEYVTKRCMHFANQFNNIDLNILYTAAAYHDIAHRIDKANHEILSAQMLINDPIICSFFAENELKIIKEAIEDHRASSKDEPRSTYGRILSTADRSTDVDDFFKRTHEYTLKHYPDISDDDILKRAISHSAQKYGINGYAKHYIEDEQYDNFINEIRRLLDNTSLFTERYWKVNAKAQTEL